MPIYSKSAAEKRHLSYQTPPSVSVHRARNGGQTLSLTNFENALRGEKLGKNRGRTGRILNPQRSRSYFLVLHHGANSNFHQNLLRITTAGEDGGQTDRRE